MALVLASIFSVIINYHPKNCCLDGFQSYKAEARICLPHDHIVYLEIRGSCVISHPMAQRN